MDCEFNGFGGELIAMGLAADDGSEWYGILPEPNMWNNWCFLNVLPVLYTETHQGALTKEEFVVSLRAFLKQYKNPNIVADWYTDLIHFFNTFSGDKHDESWSYNCKAELVMNMPMSYISETPHNALADARALRQVLESD